MKYYIDPNECAGSTDSQRIQAAVDEAVRTGCNKVVIPGFNARTGAFLWEIEQTILLPSHIYVEINNAHLRMADGVFGQMFRNANAMTPLCTVEEGEQEDIIIQGVGRALLDGGKHNGLRENNPVEGHMMVENLTILLHNVKNFKIDGLTVRDQRWWGICFAWARQGVVSNIRFELTEKCIRGSKEHPWKNQDGIDLRVGCHDILIENISGETGDDTVALTALAFEGSRSFENLFRCKYMSPDIFNVQIHNINSYNNHCAIVRLLCHNRNKLYNIDINGVVDATPDDQPFEVNEGQRTGNCVKLGDHAFRIGGDDLMCKLGEMSDITVSNVYSKALSAVTINCAVKNVSVKNVFVSKQGGNAVGASHLMGGRYRDLGTGERKNYLENIFVDGIFSKSEREDHRAPFLFSDLVAKNFRATNIVYPGGEIAEVYGEDPLAGITFENVFPENA